MRSEDVAVGRLWGFRGLAWRRGLALALLAQLACGTSPGPTDPLDTKRDATVVVLNDVGRAETEVVDIPGSDAATVCVNRCQKEFPIVPPCMVTSWDIKTCSCSLRPAPVGTACDDGVDCTTQDECVAGVCTSGPSADLVEPPTGWQPEGTPLLEPDDPAWEWKSVHLDPNCISCDGSRAYLGWLSTGSISQVALTGTAMKDGTLATLEVVPRLRSYDAYLQPVWDAPGTLLSGTMVTRRLRAGVNDYLYAGGWRQSASGAEYSSWVARYWPDGELMWESAAQPRFWGTDVLPTGDYGMYVAESGTNTAAEFLDSDFTLRVRRLDADGNHLWSADLKGVFPITRSPSRLAPRRAGGIAVAYIASEAQSNPDGTGEAAGWVASAAGVDEGGSIQWQTALSGEGLSSEMGRIASLPDDRFLVVGVQWPTFGPFDRYPVAAWLIDDDGSRLRETNVFPRLGDYFLAMAAASAVDGGALVGGYLTHYRGSAPKPMFEVEFEFWDSDGFIMKLDRHGNFEWMRLYGGAGVDTPWEIVATLDGRVTLLGAMAGVHDGQTVVPVRNWIVRTDFWGRTCGMRLGVCADKSWQECEDNNPCTINWCDPDLGCTAPPLPDGSPCGDGLTCQGAVCK
jgi:hypothetical protein